MKNLTRQFRRAMADDERVFLAYADITLANNTVLNLTNEEIWGGGFSYEEAVSEDDNFTAVGSVVIGSAEVVINNIYEEYSQYDFTNASVVLYVGMQFEDRLEKIKLGTYQVDDAVYNGATVKLSLLDNIEQFDRPYSASTLVYPATLFQIVQEACTKCGVTLANNSQTFPHYQYTISTKPDEESLTFREVLSWCATLAGCFVKCNPNGELVFGWFDTTLLDESASELDGGTFEPWSTGDLYDGGTFNPWSTGDEYDGGDLHTDRNVHYITGLWSQNIAMDDVVITGVTAYVKDDSENAAHDILQYSTGTNGYKIEISDNGFITKTNAQEIVNWLGQQLIGLRFRKLDVSQLSDPSIDAGDVGIVIDRKQNVYRILITRVAFSVSGDQTIVCGATTPSRNNATKYTSMTKSYVESRKQIKQEQSLREQAVQQLEQAIAESAGLYTTIVAQQTGGNIYYMHDTPDLIDAKVVWKMTANAWAVTDDWQGTDAATTAAHKWNAGLTVDGTLIASILSANGVNADWINTGTLSFNRCSGGTLKLGGANNGNGLLEIYGSDNTKYGTWNNTQLTLGTNENVVLKNTGEIRAKTPIWAAGGLWAVDSTYTSGNSDEVYADYRYQWIIFYDFRESASYSRGTPKIQRTTYYSGNAQHYVSGLQINANLGNLHLVASDGVDCQSNFVVRSGYTKSKAIETENYGEHLLYCYETPTPFFGDIGFGQIDETGECIVSIDDMLREGIAQTEYSVFLQKEGQGDLWVDEKDESYFIVKGTPNLKFSWELKAAQRYFEDYRLEDRNMEPVVRIEDNPDCGLQDLDEFLQELDALDDSDLSLTQSLNQLDAEYLF